MSETRQPTPTVEETLHTTLDLPFEEAVDAVQLEHELAGFESVATTRLDHLVRGALEEDIGRAALVVVCHAEIARDALAIDRGLASLLPCTTAVYEQPGDDRVHVRHVSTTKAMRDLGFDVDGAAMDDLVALTGSVMDEVWENVEALGE